MGMTAISGPFEFAEDITADVSAGVFDIEAQRTTNRHFHNVNVCGVQIDGAAATSKVSMALAQDPNKFVLFTLETGVLHRIRPAKIRNTGLTATQVVVLGTMR